MHGNDIFQTGWKSAQIHGCRPCPSEGWGSPGSPPRLPPRSAPVGRCNRESTARHWVPRPRPHRPFPGGKRIQGAHDFVLRPREVKTAIKPSSAPFAVGRTATLAKCHVKKPWKNARRGRRGKGFAPMIGVSRENGVFGSFGIGSPSRRKQHARFYVPEEPPAGSAGAPGLSDLMGIMRDTVASASGFQIGCRRRQGKLYIRH